MTIKIVVRLRNRWPRRKPKKAGPLKSRLPHTDPNCLLQAIEFFTIAYDFRAVKPLPSDHEPNSSRLLIHQDRNFAD
jgi:hypothetical protein